MSGLAARLQFSKGGDVVEKRRVLGGAEGIGTVTVRAVQEVAFVSDLWLPFFHPADLIAHHIEKEGVMGGEDDLDGSGIAVLVLAAGGAA